MPNVFRLTQQLFNLGFSNQQSKAVIMQCLRLFVLVVMIVVVAHGSAVANYPTTPGEASSGRVPGAPLTRNKPPHTHPARKVGVIRTLKTPPKGVVTPKTLVTTGPVITLPWVTLKTVQMPITFPPKPVDWTSDKPPSPPPAKSRSKKTGVKPTLKPPPKSVVTPTTLVTAGPVITSPWVTLKTAQIPTTLLPKTVDWASYKPPPTTTNNPLQTVGEKSTFKPGPEGVVTPTTLVTIGPVVTHPWVTLKTAQIPTTLPPKPVDWTLTVYTGYKLGAGTDADVFFTISGVHGKTEVTSDKKQLDTPDVDDYEKGSVDVFRLPLSISTPKTVKVELGNMGLIDAWNLDKITMSDGVKTFTARCDCWLERGSSSRTLTFV